MKWCVYLKHTIFRSRSFSTSSIIHNHAISRFQKRTKSLFTTFRQKEYEEKEIFEPGGSGRKAARSSSSRRIDSLEWACLQGNTASFFKRKRTRGVRTRRVRAANAAIPLNCSEGSCRFVHWTDNEHFLHTRIISIASHHSCDWAAVAVSAGHYKRAICI